MSSQQPSTVQNNVAPNASDSTPSSSISGGQDSQPPPVLDMHEIARRNEFSILSGIRHENIIGFTRGHDGACTLEKLDTTLDKRISEPVQMTVFQKLSVMKDVAQAGAYLHGLPKPIHHLNIQPSSIQLGCRAGIVAKISNFGLAVVTDEPSAFCGLRGAPLYNPPEALRHQTYSSASDVYSFGLTMTELMVGVSPFAHVKSMSVLLSSIESPLTFPDELPQPIADLLARCRNPKPESRPCFSEIVLTLNDMFVSVFVHENLEWARNFWSMNFPGYITVRWTEFATRMISCLDLPCNVSEITFRGVQKSKDNASGFAVRKLHCLKQLFFPGLTEDDDFMKTINLWIDLDKYGHLFGLFSDESTKLENFLDNLSDLIEMKWFHGDATGSSGPHRLAPDTFLIRLSAPAQNSLRPPNCWFTFSLKAPNGNFVRETRIQRLPGKSECIMANPTKDTFSSLFALAEAKSKIHGIAPVPSFLFNTLHPIASEYTTDDDEENM